MLSSFIRYYNIRRNFTTRRTYNNGKWNGIAIYTTLSALVGGVLIAVQYYNLESGCEELFSVLNQISEISIDNSL